MLEWMAAEQTPCSESIASAAMAVAIVSVNTMVLEAAFTAGTSSPSASFFEAVSARSFRRAENTQVVAGVPHGRVLVALAVVNRGLLSQLRHLLHELAERVLDGPAVGREPRPGGTAFFGRLLVFRPFFIRIEVDADDAPP